MSRHRKRNHVHDFQGKSIGAGLLRNVCQTCGDVTFGNDAARDEMLSVTPVTRKLMFTIAIEEELAAAMTDTGGVSSTFGQRRTTRLRPNA